jgi:hypothetical protein
LGERNAGKNVDFVRGEKMKTNLQTATISVRWGNDVEVSITLPPRKWADVKAGNPLSIRGKGYYYEGEFFRDYWNFGGGLNGALVVGYSGFGEGFNGTLDQASIKEHDVTATRKATRNRKQRAVGRKAARTKIRKRTTKRA